MNLLDYTQDDAGCAVWQRGCSNGHPAYRDADTGKTMLVRRTLWQQAHGPIKPGHIIRMTCGTPQCVEVEHMVQTTHGRLAKELGALGVMSGITRSAAIARTKRVTHGKLTDEAVRAIRTSTDTGVSLADRYGISQGHVSKIKLHRARREFTGNPFAGLAA